MSEATTIIPYFRSDDGAITVYCARWEDVHAAGFVPVREIALVHADPPYGNPDDLAPRGGAAPGHARARTTGVAVGKVRRYEPLANNDRPFDPSPILALDRPTVLWGANHYSDKVPPSPSWLVWDKRDGTAPDTGSDAELAWTNLGGALRTFRHAWRGLARASETGTVHLHPTQKPVALSAYIFQRAKLKPGDLVFVPYLGSGPDLVAAVAMGLRIIACDVESWCCRTAVSARLRAVPRAEDPAKIGPLFNPTVRG